MSQQNKNSETNDSGSVRYRKVLLIDDDKVDRYISERVIRTALFAAIIEVRHDAKEALEYMKNLMASPSELPEIIFLEINLPNMNGFDFLDAYEQMRDRVKKQCRVFILTDYPENKMLKEFITENFTVAGILGKPLSVEVLKKI